MAKAKAEVNQTAPKEQIKFYDNKEDHGVIIDWNKIFREYKKLKVPDFYYDPTTLPLTSAKYFELLSERASGKTTNILLIGMIANQKYGTVIQYIRQSDDMIKPSIANEIFAVIMSYDNGRYIREITNGKYNSIYTHWKKSYFCHINENGEMDKVEKEPFLQFLSIDHNFDYKSTYNAPRGDILIFDEFIGPNYRVNEFVDFCDLCSTIIRKRITPVIIMLANTIDCNSIYFKELEISKDIKKLKLGEHKIIETAKGTRIYAEMIGVKPTAIKSTINRLFFGFDNPKLAAITGGEQTWAFKPVPHIVNSETDKILERRIKMDCDGEYLNLDIVKTEDRGIIVNVSPCTKIHEDSIIMTNGDIRNKNQVYGLGRGKFFKFLMSIYEDNKFYFDCNETGSLFENYIKIYKQVRK